MKKIQKAILALSLVFISVQTAFADILPYPEPNSTPIPKPTDDVPPTGDKSFALILAAGIAVIALVIILRSLKSRKEK